MYKGKQPLASCEKETLTRLAAEARSGTELRQLPTAMLYKLTSYLAVNSDCVRTIADQIAFMTDLFAQKEVQKRYRAGDVGLSRM